MNLGAVIGYFFITKLLDWLPSSSMRPLDATGREEFVKRLGRKRDNISSHFIYRLFISRVRRAFQKFVYRSVKFYTVHTGKTPIANREEVQEGVSQSEHHRARSMTGAPQKRYGSIFCFSLLIRRKRRRWKWKKFFKVESSMFLPFTSKGMLRTGMVFSWWMDWLARPTLLLNLHFGSFLPGTCPIVVVLLSEFEFILLIIRHVWHPTSASPPLDFFQ